jgi:hypothetical protein
VVPWAEIGELIAQNADALHADAVHAIAQTMSETVRQDQMWWLEPSGRSDMAELEIMERQLSTSPQAGVRRLALAALQSAAQPPWGWTDERLARLEVYRLDTDPLVAAAAQFTFPPLDSQSPEGTG